MYSLTYRYSFFNYFFFSGNCMQGYYRLYQEGIYVPTEVSHSTCFCKILIVFCCFIFCYIITGAKEIITESKGCLCFLERGQYLLRSEQISVDNTYYITCLFLPVLSVPVCATLQGGR